MDKELKQEFKKIDQLATAVKEGFDDVDKRFDGVDNRLDVLEKGQEEIKLKLDNVAYRFELVDLQRRIEVLEKKVLGV